MSMNRSQLYREYMEDCGAPTCVELAQRQHRTRTARKLKCGHEVEAGTLYRLWIGLVDGEFTIDCECAQCIDSQDGMYRLI